MEAVIDEADGAPTPPGGLLQPGASWVSDIAEPYRGSDGSWLCSWAVLIAEVDEGRRVQRHALSRRGGSSR